MIKKLIVYLTVLIVIGCRIISRNGIEKSIPSIEYCHFPKNAELIINSDTFHSYIFKNRLLLEEANTFILFGNGKLYSFDSKYRKFDSTFLKKIDSIDGVKYDKNLNTIVIWQRSKSTFESYYILGLKPFTNYYLMRDDILDMNYSPYYGFLFIQSNYFSNTNTLSIYPIVKEHEDVNTIFLALERRIPVKSFNSFGNFSKKWISLRSNSSNDTLLIYPYNKDGNFYSP